MGIGPFTTYAPPGVYTRTISEPVIGQLLGGLRVPLLIGTAQETLTQTDFEIVRGSSSVADTPIFGEDAASRWVLGGTLSRPVLGNQDGGQVKFRVRNYPIVDGVGSGKVTFDVSKVSVMVDGHQAVVSAIDGVNGYITLLVPPTEDAHVTVNYYFHRKDTRVVDDVSKQVTKGAAILVAPRTENYVVTAGSSDTLVLTVNDSSSVTIKLTPGASRAASDIANDINVAQAPGLTAAVHTDAQGFKHVQLIAQGNIFVGSGNANGALGFNPGDYTGRNKKFRVFNGPIVDGSDGGITTTDVSKVVVLVNGTQILAKSVDGQNQSVTLPVAPADGSVVTVQYYFNTFQDTFDYLPNNNIVTVGNVGIAPGRHDFLNGPDFVIINQGDQSIIQWGTAVQIFAGVKTGSVALDSTQVVASLVDNRIYGLPCERYVDPATAVVSQTKFVMSLSPRTGNGRDTPLGQSLYQSITNNRIDLPTNRPDLVTVYVGKSWRDASLHPPVDVLEVDSTTNTFVLAKPVPADYKVYATFWYNMISDDTFTLNVLSSGPSGIGQYTIDSAKTGSVLGVKFTTKSSLPETVQWPSGSETLPDAFLTGGGNPVPETVTIRFDNTLDPATHASFSNASAEPYDIYSASRNFGGISIDGNAPVTVDLSLPYKAVLVSDPIKANPLSFLTTDHIVLNIDGVLLAPISLSGLTTLSSVASAINSAVNGDTQSHSDGTATFASTSPNNLASVTSYGSEQLLVIKGRNLPSATNGFASNVTVLSPTAAGQTDASAALGLLPNQTATGSYSAINHEAQLVGTQTEPFSIQAGVTDKFNLSVDGLDIGATLPAGSAVSLDDVVVAINDAYVSVASAADIATFTGDVVSSANALKAAFNTHIASTTYHLSPDFANNVTAANATDLATALVLLNSTKAAFNAHLDQSGIHLLDDTTNEVTVADATTLQSAVTLAHALRNAFNDHLSNKGSHGHDDTTNVVSTTAAVDQTTSNDLLNAIKAAFNAHLVQTGVHVTNDTVNTVSTTNAVDLSTSIALANALKTAFNAHLVQTGVHVTNDTTNAVSTASATNLSTVQTLANALKAAFNAHLTQVQGSYHVHGTNDTTNTVTAAISELVAKTGQGVNAKKLVLRSRTNTVVSQVLVKTTGTANDVLGFVSGLSAGRVQPTAAALAGALNYTSAFNALAVAYAIKAPGLGNYLEIDSLTAGGFSTVTFSSTSNSALITDTGLGIVPGSSSAIGDPAQSGFVVSSSAGLLGSHGTGTTGQTYTDETTGLRFTVLPAAAGDYSHGGSFNLVVSPTFTADASIPVRGIHGVDLTVYNTVNMNPGTTATVNTYARTGAHPRIGDVFYASYNFAKSDLSTQLFRDLKKIQANFGPPTPEFPLSLGARLALLNGAVLLALKQVVKASNGTQATVGSFTNAIDEQKKPLAGNIKPDVITPLGTDPNIFSYLNSHCIFMSSPRQEGERTGIVGVAAGTSPTGVQAVAQGLSSELMLVTYPDSFVITMQDDQGNLVDRLVDGSIAAAAIAGSTCNPSIDVATPLTRRQIIGFKSLGRILDPTEANQTAVKGVTIVEAVDGSLRIRHGLTTRIDTVITRTPSVQLTIQLVQQTMRRVLDPFIGQKFTGTLLKSVENAMVGAFATLVDAQIVAKVAGITASVDEQDPTILRAEAIYVPVFPLEYIVSTLQVRVRI